MGSQSVDTGGVVEIDRRAEPRRWRCPQNHCDWAIIETCLYCIECAGSDASPVYDWVRDSRTDDYVAVERVTVNGR